MVLRVEDIMTAIILLTAFCGGAIAFLICFFVALCRDRSRSRYVLKVHRAAYLHEVPARASKSAAPASQAG